MQLLLFATISREKQCHKYTDCCSWRKDTMPKPEVETTETAAVKAVKKEESDDDDDSVSSEEDDLNLEGVLVRNPDVSSSSDDDDDSDEDEEKEGGMDKKLPTPKTSAGSKKRSGGNDATKKKRTKKNGEPEILQVEFTFHDFNEKFFHGVKSLLHGSSPVYQSHSSALTDLMIDNVSVGTVCSTEGDTEGNVFGFGSVLNVTTYGDQPCIQYLKKICLDNCPANHKEEMETVLSGKTKRPAGFLFHARMVNMPLEITEVLQEQLALDMDWAVKNAEGGEAHRKSLDFGAFVRLAPATMDKSTLIYRFFDDEFFSTNAEFVYNINAPQSYGSEEKHMVSIIVMTKTGHRQALKELKQLVGSEKK